MEAENCKNGRDSKIGLSKMPGIGVGLMLFVLMLVGTGLRLQFLDRPLNCDEAFTFLNYADRPFEYIVSAYRYPNNHIFHTLLLRVASLVLGASPLSLRLVALVAGLLLIPAMYFWTRSVFDHRAGAVAALLVAVAPVCVDFSTRGRGYTLLVLLIVCWLWHLSVLLRREVLSSGALTTSALLAALGFWTMPLMLYPFIAGMIMATSMVCSRAVGRRRRHLYALRSLVIRVCVLCALLYLPAALDRLSLPSQQRNVFGVMSWSEFFGDLPTVWRLVVSAVTAGWPHWLNLLLAVAALIGLLAPVPAQPGYRRGIGWAVLVVATVFLVLHTTTRARFWFFLVPFYIQLVAVGLAAVCRKLSNLSFLFAQAAGACVLVASTVVPVVMDDLIDAEAMTKYLRQSLVPGDVVLPKHGAHITLGYWFYTTGLGLDWIPAYFEGHEDLARQAAHSAPRAYLVVDDLHYKVEDVLRFYEISGPIKKVAQFPNGAIYLLER